LAIEAARADNMPKENIDRAIAKAAGKEGVNLEEAVYEGFGPGGFNFIIEAFTDNKQRTVAEVKNAIDKNGGTMGAQGSVMYQFERKGVITIVKKEKSTDDIFAIAVDSGAEDVEEAGDEALIYSRPEDLAIVRSYLAGKGICIQNAELIYKPIVLFPITDKATAEKAVAFLEKLEELEDVQKVFANFDIPDAIMG
jgi:YebC/PmpR family DNA-binding regulatory protein